MHSECQLQEHATFQESVTICSGPTRYLCGTALLKAPGDGAKRVTKSNMQMPSREGGPCAAVPGLCKRLSAQNVPSSTCGEDVVGLDAEPAAQLCVHLLKSSMVITLIVIARWCEREGVINLCNLFSTCRQALPLVNNMN